MCIIQLAILFAVQFLSRICVTYSLQPQQIHLALGDNSFDIVVTWTTFRLPTLTDEPMSIVQYGPVGSNLLKKVSGTINEFPDPTDKHISYIHRVQLTDLLISTEYVYQCGCRLGGWSEKFKFRTGSNDSKSAVRLAMFGDLGLEKGYTMPALIADTLDGMYDAIIDVGDFAYNMDSECGKVGDGFMQAIEPMAARVPFMTCVGNHEEKGNFSNYKARFNMPNRQTENMWYSFNIGPVHFVAFSSEVYYYYKEYYLKPLIEAQFKWLEKDLTEATASVNRTMRPWIIALCHRPMYCSNYDPYDADDCNNHGSILRVGLNEPDFPSYAMEPLLKRFGVDILFNGHQHSFERLWPIYNYTVLNGTYDEPYTNAGGIVHLVSGAAGNLYSPESFKGLQPKWSAFRDANHSYTRLNAHNRTHLHFEQVATSETLIPSTWIIDSFWMIKNKK